MRLGRYMLFLTLSLCMSSCTSTALKAQPLEAILPAEERYELIPLTADHEQQYVEDRQRAGRSWWKDGKRIVWKGQRCVRVDDDGRELASFLMPEEAIGLSCGQKFVGYRLGTKVHILDDQFKVTSSFETILRDHDACIVQSGKIYILRWGHKEVRPLAIPGVDPRPMPPGFAVYDQTGRVTLSEDEASGWTISDVSRALVTFKRVDDQWQAKVSSYDGKHSRTASGLDPKGSWPRIGDTLASPYLLWVLGGRTAEVLDEKLHHIETLDLTGFAQVRLVGDRLFLLRSPDAHTLTWQVRQVGRPQTAEPQSVTFDKNRVTVTGRGFEITALPGRPDRIVLLLIGGSTNPECGGVVRLVVAEAATGAIVWTCDPYEMGRLINGRIEPSPWDDAAVIVPGPARGWAILRPVAADVPAAPEAGRVAQLVTALGSETAEERAAAKTALLSFGTAAVPFLAKYAEDESSEVRARVTEVVRTLAGHWGPAVNGLQVGIESQQERYTLGQPMRLKWTIRNIGRISREIPFYSNRYGVIAIEAAPKGQFRTLRGDRPKMPVDRIPILPDRVTLKPGDFRTEVLDLAKFHVDRTGLAEGEPFAAGTWTVVGVYDPRSDPNGLGRLLKRPGFGFEYVVADRIDSTPMEISIVGGSP